MTNLQSEKVREYKEGIKPKIENPNEPKSKELRWMIALACAICFPLIYLIGRAIIYLIQL